MARAKCYAGSGSGKKCSNCLLGCLLCFAAGQVSRRSIKTDRANIYLRICCQHHNVLLVSKRYIEHKSKCCIMETQHMVQLARERAVKSIWARKRPKFLWDGEYRRAYSYFVA